MFTDHLKKGFEANPLEAYSIFVRVLRFCLISAPEKSKYKFKIGNTKWKIYNFVGLGIEFNQYKWRGKNSKDEILNIVDTDGYITFSFIPQYSNKLKYSALLERNDSSLLKLAACLAGNNAYRSS